MHHAVKYPFLNKILDQILCSSTTFEPERKTATFPALEMIDRLTPTIKASLSPFAAPVAPPPLLMTDEPAAAHLRPPLTRPSWAQAPARKPPTSLRSSPESYAKLIEEPKSKPTRSDLEPSRIPVVDVEIKPQSRLRLGMGTSPILKPRS